MSRSESSIQAASSLGTRDDHQHRPLYKWNEPGCLCSGTLLGMFLALVGMVLTGVGACVVAFMYHETLPLAIGILVVAVGVLLMIGGLGYFLYDYYISGPRRNKYERQEPDHERPRTASPASSSASSSLPPPILRQPERSPPKTAAPPPRMPKVLQQQAPALPPHTTTPPKQNGTSSPAPPAYQASVKTTTTRLDPNASISSVRTSNTAV